MIKIGRRGSISGMITVNGRQGHAAYPHLADNPVRGLMTLCDALLDPALDEGTEDFQPTNLEVTSVDVGNPATNVIPAKATASSTSASTTHGPPKRSRREIHNRLDRASRRKKYRAGRAEPIALRARLARPAERSVPDPRREADRDAERLDPRVTGHDPALSTSGGTSDARFIKDYCPVVEFGLVGKTMHMVDERVAVADLETLTDIYGRFLEDWFG